MKPLTLDIAGLNGFRAKQTIDFDRLLDHGIFGIFGPTGSGKSSVLDAITLALYGKVKRAQNGKSGIINLQEKTCSVSLTFELDGGGERKRYTIERALARGAGKDGTVVTKKARLIRHHDEEQIVLADKQKEIDEKVLELLGIEYPEFLRAVVLPQNSFAEFLGLPNKERSLALQRLFGLSEMGQRLAMRLRGMGDKVKGERQLLDGRLAELRAFDDTVLAEWDARLATAVEAEREARYALTSLETQLAEAEKLESLCAERDALLERESHRPEIEAECLALRTRIERGERSARVQPLIEAHARGAARAAAAATALGEAQARMADAAATLKEAKEIARVAIDHHDAAYDRLGREADELERIAGDRMGLEAKAAAVESTARSLSTLTEECEGLEVSLVGAREAARGAEEAIARDEKRIEELTVAREILDRLGELRMIARELRRSEQSLAEAERALKTSQLAIAEREKELVEHSSFLEKCEKELVVLRSELLPARQAVEDHEGRRSVLLERAQAIRELLSAAERDEAECIKREQVCREQREQLESENGEWALVMRKLSSTSERHVELVEAGRIAAEQLDDGYRRLAVATLVPRLRDGEPCPVCGSIEHPGRSNDAEGNEGDLARLKSAFQRHERDLASVVEEMAVLSQRMGAIDSRRGAIGEVIEREEHALHEASIRLHTTLAAAGEPGRMATVADLRRYREEIESEGNSFGEQIAAARERAGDIEKRIEELAEATREHGRRADILVATIETLGTDAETQRTAILAHRAEITAQRAALLVDSEGRELDEIERDLTTLQERGQAAEGLRVAVSAERRRLAELCATRDKVRDAYEHAKQRRDVEAITLRHLEEDLRTESERLRRRVAEVCADGERATDPSELSAARRRMRDDLERARSDAERALQEAESDWRVAASESETRSEALRTDTAELDGLARDLATALAVAGFSMPEDAAEASLDPEALGHARSQLLVLEDELRNLAKRLQELAQLIGERSIAPKEARTLREQRDDARATADAAIGESAAARAQLETAAAMNAEFHRMLAEGAEQTAKARVIERLGRYLQGDSFINYLADEKLADVCVRASRLLEDLTCGQFALTTRPSEGFVIMDFANGAERSPSSLSGGETFLVSLALALALSDAIQLGRSPLEFFFLDEGFGTLDEELLETVVTALERLRSQRRTIGLITHVGMLRERIPRRLVITPPTATRGSLISYEVG